MSVCYLFLLKVFAPWSTIYSHNEPTVQISSLSTEFIADIYKLFNIHIQAKFNYRRGTSSNTNARH